MTTGHWLVAYHAQLVFESIEVARKTLHVLVQMLVRLLHLVVFANGHFQLALAIRDGLIETLPEAIDHSDVLVGVNGLAELFGKEVLQT